MLKSPKTEFSSHKTSILFNYTRSKYLYQNTTEIQLDAQETLKSNLVISAGQIAVKVH
jgi:hypothetical protein